MTNNKIINLRPGEEISLRNHFVPVPCRNDQEGKLGEPVLGSRHFSVEHGEELLGKSNKFDGIRSIKLVAKVDLVAVVDGYQVDENNTASAEQIRHIRLPRKGVGEPSLGGLKKMTFNAEMAAKKSLSSDPNRVQEYVTGGRDYAALYPDEVGVRNYFVPHPTEDPREDRNLPYLFILSASEAERFKRGSTAKGKKAKTSSPIQRGLAEPVTGITPAHPRREVPKATRRSKLQLNAESYSSHQDHLKKNKIDFSDLVAGIGIEEAVEVEGNYNSPERVNNNNLLGYDPDRF